MNENIFHFKFGSYQCVSVRDSVQDMELNMFYPEITCSQIEQIFQQYHMPPVTKFETTCLILKGNQHTILVDTGWGDDSPEPGSGRLMQLLPESGVDAWEIDTVIHSHGHPDHVSGNTDARGQSNFPHARHFICRNDWDFWTSNPQLEEAGDKIITIRKSVKKNLFAIQNQFQTLDDGVEFLPGLKLMQTPGHTPGHSSYIISSGNEKLMCLGDVFHSPLGILYPRWKMPMDHRAEEAIKSRIRVIEMAFASQSLVFGAHLPFPGIGHIVKQDAVFLWKPISI